MDYEKKYKQALERAEEIIRYYKERNRGDEISIEDLETVFPELAESEDEKIRNALIRFHKSTIDIDGIEGADILAWLEKQGSSPVKWQKNTPHNKPAIKHSVLMKTTQGIAEGEWQGEHWFQYRWSWTLKDSAVLYWMELSDLDEQDEQKSAAWSDEDERAIAIIKIALEHPYDMEGKWDRKFALDWLKSLKDRIGG